LKDRPCIEEPVAESSWLIAYTVRMSETILDQHAKPATAKKTRIFSGIQPSDDLHIGNYLGAVKNWVAIQGQGDHIYCAVDLHVLTLPDEIDPKVLYQKSRDLIATLMACGLDPKQNIIFVQSHVREHTELAWILNCVTPLGWLHQMTQFKSKSERSKSIGTGLLDYPVLQAADIILYDTDEVPVGEDQVQHIELTRDIATRFNNLFGETFVLPKAVVPKVGARIMGLDEPEVKMSKSIARVRPHHAIGLLDDEKKLKKTIMSSVTDSERETRFEHASPGVVNLLEIYESLTHESRETIEATFEGKGYGELKKAVLAAVIDTLEPIQKRYKELMSDRTGLESIIAQGADQAREIAVKTMEKVRKAVGVG
jgi:tryptophanyl-tRNA synthetase